MAEVYSRRSMTDPLVEFIDPVSSRVVRTTEAGRSLRALTRGLARDAVALDETLDCFAEYGVPVPPSSPAGHAARPRRRTVVLGVLAGIAIGAGATVALLGLTGALAPTPADSAVAGTTPEPSAAPNNPFQLFTEPSEVVTGIAPLLGPEFLPLNVRSLPNPAADLAGFHMFVAERSDNSFCLILQHPDNSIQVACATGGLIARRGLRTPLWFP
jgi:hypothetical protein